MAVNAVPAAPQAALAASLAAAATASTIASPACSRAVLSIKNAVCQETRSVSKKSKVDSPSGSDPATPQGGSVTLLSQLDGEAQSPTPPILKLAPKKLPPDSGDCNTAKSPRCNPRKGLLYRSTTLVALTPWGVPMQLQTLQGASAFLRLQSLQDADVFTGKL